LKMSVNSSNKLKTAYEKPCNIVSSVLIIILIKTMKISILFIIFIAQKDLKQLQML